MADEGGEAVVRKYVLGRLVPLRVRSGAAGRERRQALRARHLKDPRNLVDLLHLAAEAMNKGAAQPNWIAMGKDAAAEFGLKPGFYRLNRKFRRAVRRAGTLS